MNSTLNRSEYVGLRVFGLSGVGLREFGDVGLQAYNRESGA